MSKVELTPEQAVFYAESATRRELQAIMRDYDLTPAQMLRIVLRATSDFVAKYLKSLDETAPEG